MLKPVDIKTAKVFDTKEEANEYTKRKGGEWIIKPFQRFDGLYFWKAVRLYRRMGGDGGVD